MWDNVYEVYVNRYTPDVLAERLVHVCDVDGRGQWRAYWLTFIFNCATWFVLGFAVACFLIVFVVLPMLNRCGVM
jgi:hypothetical protein